MKLIMAALVAAVALVAPAASSSVADVIAGNSELSTFNSFLTASGQAAGLSGAGPFTVFAPTNAAFAKLDNYRTAYLKANLPELTSVMRYHIAGSSVPTSGLTLHEHIQTLQGADVFVEYVGNTTTLGLVSATCDKDVNFQGSEMTASNGLVQMIDTVMMPPNTFCPDNLFFAEQRGESRIGYVGYDCRAKGTTALTNNEEKPVGLAVDSSTKSVFWSNDENAQPFDSWLTKIDFDGSNKKVFLNDLFDPQGMEVDEKAGKLYFTEHQGYKLHRASLDGTDIETLKVFNKANEFPADVAIDPNEELIFVAVQSNPQVLEGKLVVMAYNGSNYKVLKENLVQNYGLCVDTHAKHVYYIQGGHGGSVSCYPYGSTPCGGKDGVLITGLNYPYMCSVDNLWAPYGGPTTVVFSETSVPGNVYAMDSQGNDVRLINTQLDAPMGVKFGCVKNN